MVQCKAERPVSHDLWDTAPERLSCPTGMLPRMGHGGYSASVTHVPWVTVGKLRVGPMRAGGNL